MCVGIIYIGGFFIFIGGNLFVIFINGIGKLDFLHLSKLITAKFFKHLSISSNVVLRKVFLRLYCLLQ